MSRRRGWARPFRCWPTSCGGRPSPEELKRVRKEILTDLPQWRDARARARGVRPRPLRTPLRSRDRGLEPTVGTMTRADGSSTPRTFSRATTIVAAGDVTAPFFREARGLRFLDRERRPAAVVPAAPRRAGGLSGWWTCGSPRRRYARPGRAGAQTPDYFPLIVANTLLGGSFTSRLNQNLRERTATPTERDPFFHFRLSTGPFFAAAAVQTTGPPRLSPSSSRSSRSGGP
jgi:predicted Zn-dependent peptidase